MGRSVQVQVTDPTTGEMILNQSLKVDTKDQVRDAYGYVKALQNAAESLKDEIKPHAKRIVNEWGEDDIVTYPDGYQLRHVSYQKFKIKPKILFQHIDPSQILPAISISKTALEKKFKSMTKKEEIDGSVIKAIKKEAYSPDGAADHYQLEKQPK